MRVAVPVTADGSLDPRWGRAHRVATADVVDGDVVGWHEHEVSWDTLHDEGTEGAHHARIVRFIREQGVDAVVVHHVGPGMQRTLDSMQVRVVHAPPGDARAAARAVAGG